MYEQTKQLEYKLAENEKIAKKKEIRKQYNAKKQQRITQDTKGREYKSEKRKSKSGDIL